MATHLFYEFPQDEQDQAIAAAAAHGLNFSEFDIVDEDAYCASGHAGRPYRRVTVRCVGNGVTENYAVGPGRCWTVVFERDLALGAFGDD